MAKFYSTTFGTISGRHGSAVAATTKDGKSYLRVFRAPSDPKTEKQVAQRTKFAFANSALSCFRNLFKETFNNSRGMNLGVSHAMKMAITGDSPDFAIDYSKLVFSTGNVNQAIAASAEITAETTITLTWDMVEASQSKSTDRINIILFNEDTLLSILKKDACQRGDRTFSLELPEVWRGSTVYCWIYLTESNNSASPNHSLSQFVASLEV